MFKEYENQQIKDQAISCFNIFCSRHYILFHFRKYRQTSPPRKSQRSVVAIYISTRFNNLVHLNSNLLSSVFKEKKKMITSRATFTILSVLLSFILFSQEKKYFEGMIKHKYFFKSRSLSIDSLNISNASGDIYFFHKNIYQGTTLRKNSYTTYTYDAKRNHCLFYESSNDMISCYDYSVVAENELIKVSKKQGKFKVNGFECDLIVLEYANRTYYKYVTDKFYINPTLYVNHKAYDYNRIMSALDGRLAIRTEIIYADYTMVMDLVDYHESNQILEGYINFDEYWEVCK